MRRRLVRKDGDDELVFDEDGDEIDTVIGLKERE